ncbi:universal stress protein [Ideonella sp. BN130291]|uniref:universal stress protein n=1 Tax=Ideonella sp. BN130291 TaxID=3112940 RepID=UPI002E26D438|nr:universal stress protein [Ideonella sp. BN130291]
MSALRSLLVHVDASPRSRARLLAARDLADQHGACITALLSDTPGEVDTPYSYTAGAADAQALQDMALQRRASARSLFEAVFTDRTRACWAELPPASDAPAFARYACSTDLLVLGQDAADPGAGLQRDFAPAVMAACGRPALVWPREGRYALPAETAVVAWNATAGSARALAAALPLLRQARHVHVVNWGEATVPRLDGCMDIESHLALHGITAQVHRYGKAPGDIGGALLQWSKEVRAGLLVMGCYGHSPARERLLGGATRAILERMTLPVLMAH